MPDVAKTRPIRPAAAAAPIRNCGSRKYRRATTRSIAGSQTMPSPMIQISVSAVYDPTEPVRLWMEVLSGP